MNEIEKNKLKIFFSDLKEINCANLNYEIFNAFFNKYFDDTDFDLYDFNKYNKYEIEIKKVVTYFYKNADNVINDYTNENAKLFIYNLNKSSAIEINELISYLSNMKYL